MATSGSKTIAVTAHDELRFDWSSSQVVESNYSNVSWTMKLITDPWGRISSTAPKAWSVSVDGKTYSGNNYIGIGNNSTKTLASGSKTIYHNSDGTKTFSYSFSQYFGINFSGVLIKTKSSSGIGTLNTISRTSSISSISGDQFGSNITVYISRKSSSFTHNIYYKRPDGTSERKVTGATTYGTFKMPISDCKNADNATCYIKVDTYSGSSYIGTTGYVARTIYVPSNIKPSISELKPTKQSGNSTVSGWDIFVKDYSKVKLTASASGAEGSSITNYFFNVKRGNTDVFSSSQSDSSWTSNLFTIPGDYTFYVKVTDSRGRTAEKTKGPYTVYDYKPPSVSDVDVFRCLLNGTEDTSSGTYISAKGTFAYSSVNGNNTLSKKIQYRQKQKPEADWIDGQTDPLNATAYVFGAGGIGITKTYQVQFAMTDLVTGTVTHIVEVRTGEVTLHIRPGGKGIGIFGAADGDGLQIYKNLKTVGSRVDTAPIRVNLSPQMQNYSYRRSVIALCDLTNDNISANSYSQGIITLHRSNGLIGCAQTIVNIEKKYNSTVPNISLLSTIPSGAPASGIAPCTFTYNGVKYGGLEIYISAAEFAYVEFFGATNFDIFGLDYYQINTSKILNAEVYNSINTSDFIYSGNLYFNGTKIN